MTSISELLLELTAKIQAAAVGPPAISAGPLDGAKALLITDAQGTVGPDPAFGDVTQPTFTGYPAVLPTVTWGTPFINPALQAEVSGGVFVWAATATGLPNVITAVALTDSASAKILKIYWLQTPITITNAHDGFASLIAEIEGGGA